jgi:hypothetical protein
MNPVVALKGTSKGKTHLCSPKGISGVAGEMLGEVGETFVLSRVAGEEKFPPITSELAEEGTKVAGSWDSGVGDEPSLSRELRPVYPKPAAAVAATVNLRKFLLSID